MTQVSTAPPDLKGPTAIGISDEWSYWLKRLIILLEYKRATEAVQ